ncbi:unnamed protein product [marine sediment metagenome]|uniref:Uncharacterized protein n=1 Tax=marine sediment metagenome TaxID=412755 RepID=X0RZZ8_9ZZZZ
MEEGIQKGIGKFFLSLFCSLVAYLSFGGVCGVVVVIGGLFILGIFPLMLIDGSTSFSALSNYNVEEFFMAQLDVLFVLGVFLGLYWAYKTQP